MSESGTIAQGFVDRGYRVVDFGEAADVTFVNTCTVTDSADSTCRNLIRKAHKASPEGMVVVAGCYAQMEPETIASMQGVDLVLGTSEKYKVFDYLESEEKEKIHVDRSNEFWGAATTPADSHTRAFLKIQDGCNYVCSFCIIPFARGRSKAISIFDAAKEANELASRGFKEVILTGVNIGEYEHTSGEKLVDMVRAILDVRGISRLRLSSVECNTITDELLDTFKESDKFLDHFHIPLQSGSDEILTGMKRKYSVTTYSRTIGKIVSRFPNAGIGADIIVGFPGETLEQFEETKTLLEELPITHFHVFPYSKRKGTVAAKMENHIHHDEKKRRVNELIELGERKLAQFSEENVGKRSKVLFERRNKQGHFEGYTSNYLKVWTRSDNDLKNMEREVLITDFKEGQLYAEILQ